MTKKITPLPSDYFINNFKDISSKLDTTKLIALHNRVVDELIKRYFKLRDKERLSNNLSPTESIELETLGECVKKEMRRKVEPGSLEDRVNRFLDENLPL